MKPLIHYIFFGYKEGKLPSEKFDGNYYLNTYKNIKKAGLNPLVHYILYGKNEGKIIKSNYENHKLVKYSVREVNNIISVLDSEKISIILYINNNFEDVEKSVLSVLKYTKINYELIIIDDFSLDNDIKSLLKKLESKKYVTVIKNPKKYGFLKSVNTEIRNSNGDILIIKSNTIVTSHWLQKMIVSAYSDEKIGTVIPLSNSFKFLLDTISQTTGIKELNPDEIAYLIENVSEHQKSEIIYPNESCIYIKREVINDVGLFNEEINDLKKAGKKFYQKVLDKDWKNIIDVNTYVNQKSDSIDEDWNDCIESNPQISNIGENIKIRARDSNLSIPKKRLLYVLHENAHGLTGGTGQTTKDILGKLDENFECYILVSSVKSLTLWKNVKNQMILIKSWKTRSKWSVEQLYNDEFKEIYFQIIFSLNIDILHIQHIIGHSFDLIDIAKILSIPIILSFHDFYYICPSIHLLDHNNHYCEGKCTAFTAPTESTKEIYMSIYPQLENKPFNVIEHGRDFQNPKSKFEIPSENKPIKILVPGNIKYHKGHDFIKEIISNDHENRLEFHFMGTIYSDLKEMGIYHGKYRREDFCKIVNKIKPSFIGIFSICPETYCHTLSESWSCGIPVLATKIGALQERIENNGGGWFLDLESPLKAYNKIIQIANSPDKYLKVAKEVHNIHLKSKIEMVKEYELLYKENLNK